MNMKKHLMTLLACFAVFVSGNAKEVMTMVDGQELEVVILTIGTSEISYKKASNPDGPTYTTARDKVFFIVYDNGTKEVITPLDRQQQGVGASAPAMADYSTGTGTISDVAQLPPEPEKNYFPRISFMPRASVGFHATPSGYKDEFDIDWGGLSWSFDLNVLFPSSNTSAWSIGLGLAGLGGEMNMLYVSKDKHHKDKMGDFTTMYLTIPVQYWWKVSDWFMFGFGDRLEFLVSQKAGGEKIEDSFRGFRDAFMIDGIVTIGQFDLGAQFLFNFSSAMKGEDLDWSPTFGFSFTAGYRF